tara:strand:- start:27 stop:2048 length:2022 start_codon:yes stop_codon:yes gene_type:complete
MITKNNYLIAGITALMIWTSADLYGAGWNFERTKRAKLWTRVWNNGGIGLPTLSGNDLFKYDYPGHELTSDINDHTGVVMWAGWMTWAEVDGVGTPFRLCMAYDPNPAYISPTQDATLVTNYNMADPSLLAEEIITGGAKIVEYDLDFSYRTLAWSYPELDDFIIWEFTFTNNGSKNLTNFRFAPTAEMNISIPGGSDVTRDDDDFEWDIAHEAFYFHDGQSVNTAGELIPAAYGLTGDDIGGPSDTEFAASLDHSFRAAHYFTYYWLDKPTKSDPTERDHMNIVDKNNLNQHANRIQQDPMNDNPEVDFDTDDYILAALKYDNPLPLTSEDGVDLTSEATRLGLTVAAPQLPYEKHMSYLYSTGPYSIAPGEQLKFVMVSAMGMMDNDRVMAGGVENKAHLSDGADSLWKNVDAAATLYARGYQAFDPPPTPTNGNNSLTLTPVPTGVKIQWPPISESYTDPDYGVNDFAGYRIYRSTVKNIGPWKLIADIPKGSETIEGSMVTYEDLGLSLGVGVYYQVSSYDTGHNTAPPWDCGGCTGIKPLESGRVNVNTNPVYPMADPSNNLDDVRVYPNPFIQDSGLLGSGESKRIEFVNIPGACTIRIYTLAGEILQTIEHDDGSGDSSWGSKTLGDYQVNKYLQAVAPGIYIWHITNNVESNKGETKAGTFVIIK